MNINIQANINTYLIKHNILTDYIQYKTYDEKNHVKHANHTKTTRNKKVELGNTLAER